MKGEVYGKRELSPLVGMANIEEVQYSGHWPGTIFLFSIVTNQIQNKRL